MREGIFAPLRLVPRSEWQFARDEKGTLVPDPNFVTLKGGFKPGLTYEVAYETKNPPVAGLGLAAIRDVASALKYNRDAIAPGRYAYMYGSSQTGRLIRHMVYEGFTVDEQGRKAFDAAFVQTGGTGRGSFNERFAQPNALGSFTETKFPILYRPTIDPVTGIRDGLGARIPPGLEPKLFLVDTASEYWDRGRVAALRHLSLDGGDDVVDAPNVRVFQLAGTQHGSGSFPPTQGNGQFRTTSLDYRWAQRGLLAALDSWVRNGTEPPPSRHPMLSDGTLVAHRQFKFPAIPGVPAPTFVPGGYRPDVHGSVLRPAVLRAAGRRRWQRSGRHPAARAGRAAGDLYGLAFPKRAHRRAAHPARDVGSVSAVPVDAGGARGQRRSPSLDRGAVRQPVGLPAKGGGSREPSRCRALSPQRRRRAHRRAGRAPLGLADHAAAVQQPGESLVLVFERDMPDAARLTLRDRRSSRRASVAAAGVILLSLAGVRAAGAQEATERDGVGLPLLAATADAVVIDGPAAPVPPAVISRDDNGRATVRAVRLERPLSIDGQLDEDVYSVVPGAGDFIQQEPREGDPATEKTEVWVLFDDKNVYVAARCWDSQPDRWVLTELRRDNNNITNNENFSVVFDTFYDRRNGFFFQTSPLSAVRDQTFTDEGNGNTSWNTIWAVKSGRFEGGWSFEMAIPFKSLRYRDAGPQIWGINFRRMVKWKNEESYLTRMTAAWGNQAVFHVSAAGTLVGLETPGAIDEPGAQAVCGVGSDDQPGGRRAVLELTSTATSASTSSTG